MASFPVLNAISYIAPCRAFSMAPRFVPSGVRNSHPNLLNRNSLDFCSIDDIQYQCDNKIIL